MNSSTPSQVTASLTSEERTSVLSIIAVFALRMLGLFMLLPVLSLYASKLPGATPLLAGIAVGVYGLSQALLQIPFGWASDRYGRRRLLVIGLCVFALGSVVAALSHSIWGVIIGRILQGAGAISAVLTALLSDVIAPQKRTRAMAMVGASIGLSFLLALILGPLISSYVGVSGLFFVSAACALAALCTTVWFLPDPPVLARPERLGFTAVFANRALWRLNFGIFTLHFVLAAVFVVLPFVMQEQQHIAAAGQARVLTLILLLSLPGTIVLILIAEKRDGRNKAFSSGTMAMAIAMIVVAMLLLFATFAHLGSSRWGLIAIVAGFFAAFNFLEARLPAQVSLNAGEEHRGTALGVYASSQFLGVFAGAAIAGWCMGYLGQPAVFAVCAAMGVLWLGTELAALLKNLPKK